MQGVALVTVAAEPLRLRALAERIGTTDATASRTVDALESAGLVRRASAPDDGRGVVVHVTPAGRRRLEERRGTLRGGARGGPRRPGAGGPRAARPPPRRRRRRARPLLGGRRPARAGRGPLGELVPVRRPERLAHGRVGVLRVEDVVVEVAADRHVRRATDVRDRAERLRREPRLGDRVVLELEVRRELEQLRPVGAACGSSRVPQFGGRAGFLPGPAALDPDEPALVAARVDEERAPPRRGGAAGARSPGRSAPAGT